NIYIYTQYTIALLCLNEKHLDHNKFGCIFFPHQFTIRIFFQTSTRVNIYNFIGFFLGISLTKLDMIPYHHFLCKVFHLISKGFSDFIRRIFRED
ncbi:hypothetical protein ACJX0J_023271, partial [Zea mays]